MSETTWQSIVEQYKERAVRDGARIDELRQTHVINWHDTAEMLKWQRSLAEEERDGWKIRAMKAEQERQALRAEVVELREDRDSQKLRAETAERDRQTLLTKGTKFEQEWRALTTANTNLRDQLILAEGQRDQAKADAEDIGNNWQRSLDAMMELVRPTLARHGLAVQPTTGEGA